MTIWQHTLAIGAILTATVLLIYAQQPADPPIRAASEPPLFLAVDVAPPTTAQTFTTLQSFDGTNGAYPGFGALVQTTNGDLYGATAGGGADTVFKITPSGTLTTLWSFGFQNTDGSGTNAGLVQATNGDLYGTTQLGGANPSPAGTGGGTVFKITPSGMLTTLYSFCAQSRCTDGEYPYAGLVQATNGDFYGTTNQGGASNGGTVFKITPSGTLTTLYSFCSQGGSECTDGFGPMAGLVQATNGYLYGTTRYGGTGKYSSDGGGGTVFKITPSGTLTTLYSFCSQSGCADGEYPFYGALVQATSGDLYGTTAAGGYDIGTVFKITPSGTLATLYTFGTQSTDGLDPLAGLVQATDGNFYGTTQYGGTGEYGSGGAGGTVFKITPSGTLTTLYSFCSQGRCADGSSPYAGVVQATNGDFYGTTYEGGTIGCGALVNGCGTVFRLSVGLDPFVETQTNSGNVGAAVRILGSDLTGATGVTFNGTAAAFTVVSRYLITTTVPAGATTGKVQVVTPSRTLSSNMPFRVP